MNVLTTTRETLPSMSALPAPALDAYDAYPRAFTVLLATLRSGKPDTELYRDIVSLNSATRLAPLTSRALEPHRAINDKNSATITALRRTIQKANTRIAALQRQLVDRPVPPATYKDRCNNVNHQVSLFDRPLEESVLPQRRPDIILDTGANLHCTPVAAPDAPLQTTPPVTIHLPDNSVVTSTLAVQLPFPATSLPPAALTTQLVPAFHSTLVSVGQLCDYGCTAQFIGVGPKSFTGDAKSSKPVGTSLRVFGKSSCLNL